jgi:hypothetical protein
LKPTASLVAAFALTYKDPSASSIADNWGSLQILISFGEIAFVQLKLAAVEMVGSELSTAAVHNSASRVPDIADR